MDFSAATTYFDDTQVFEAYTGVFSFMCQLDLFDGTTSDSTTTTRRSISVGDSIVIPDSKAIRLLDEAYLVGRGIQDAFQGDTARKHFVVHPANLSVNIQWAADLLDGVIVDDIYSAKSWRKQSKDILRTSELFQIYNFYFTDQTSLTIGQTLTSGTKQFKISGLEDTTSGFILAECYELSEGALQEVTYTAFGSTYDPVDDDTGVGVPSTFDIILDRFKINYEVNFPSSEVFKPEDYVALISVADIADPRVDDLIATGTKSLRVVSKVSDFHGAWMLHMEPI